MDVTSEHNLQYKIFQIKTLYYRFKRKASHQNTEPKCELKIEILGKKENMK